MCSIGSLRMDEVTLDGLFGGKVKLLQPRRGYRFSVDAPILASFVTLREGDRVIELGTGNGVILIILGKKGIKASRMVGVEIQPELAELARRNAELNCLSGLIEVIHGDIRECRRIFGPQGFDVVISNPPYYPVPSGRLNIEDKRALARHEVAGTLSDFLDATSYLLRDRGRCFYIYPAKRAITLFWEMKKRGLEPKRLRWVHSRAGEGARMVLVEGVKGGGEGLEVEPPLVIFDPQGDYTPQMGPILFDLEVKDEN